MSSKYMMSLCKIPLIIFLTLDFIAILTSPQPEPPKNEVANTISIDVRRVRQLRHLLVRTGQILLAILETLSIVFHYVYASNQDTIAQDSPLIQFRTIFPQLYTTPISVFGSIFWLVGTRLRLAAFAGLGKFFRFDISIQKSHELVTTGPYAYVRHPSYSGIVLTNIGWICYHLSPGSWLRESGMLSSVVGRVLLTLYLGVGLLPTMLVTLGRLKKEEEMLRRAFGKEWEDWALRVPSKIIPGVY